MVLLQYLSLHHKHHHHLSLDKMKTVSVTIIIYHHHNHHHLSLSYHHLTTICHYHYHNHHQLSLSSQPLSMNPVIVKGTKTGSNLPLCSLYQLIINFSRTHSISVLSVLNNSSCEVKREATKSLAFKLHELEAAMKRIPHAQKCQDRERAERGEPP